MEKYIKKYMGFETNTPDKVQIQVKDPYGGKSKSFTIYNTNIDDIFNRIVFLLKCIEKSTGDITIKHIKTDNIKCGGIK
jgi:hypothetical protein